MKFVETGKEMVEICRCLRDLLTWISKRNTMGAWKYYSNFICLKFFSAVFEVKS